MKKKILNKNYKKNKINLKIKKNKHSKYYLNVIKSLKRLIKL